MCGYAGIISKNREKPDPAILKKMADSIHHRGPDAEGVFFNEAVGFHHKRLSVIDLQTGSQPMTIEHCTIVYNGEVYNYIELREELKKKGHKFITASDTEVIVRLYLEFGEDCILLLNGMFSFIIYDHKKKEILVARDHFGIKPLYWFENEKFIAFGSEIKALLRHPEIKAEPEWAGVKEYLTFQYILGEGTMFRNIKKLKPGHYLKINLGNFRTREVKYWEPNFRLDPYHTEEYFIVELKKILEDIVFQQLRSDVPLGTYLSGGIDSSLVTSMAAKYSRDKIKSFTGYFDEGPEFNELEYARKASRESGTELHEVCIKENDFLELLPKLIYHLDEPVAGPGLFPQYVVSKMASKHVKVILGGQGGDEIFGGYARYVIAYLEQAIKGAIHESNEEGEHIVSLSSILPNLPYLQSYLPMMKTFMADGVFDSMDRRYFRLINRMPLSEKLLMPGFYTFQDSEEIFSKFSAYFNHSDTLSYFNKMTHFDMFGSLPGLLQVEDRVSMAVSIESRVPILDRRIVDLISVMPARMKFRGAEMKYLLKKTIRDMIPAEILNRKNKMGFPVPLHIWLKGKTGEFAKDILLSKSSKERGIFIPAELEKMINRESQFGRSMWGLLSLELWFRQFIDNKP